MISTERATSRDCTSDLAAEGVTGPWSAGLVAAFEPVLALRRGTVRPGLPVDLPLRLRLDPVVSDGRGGVECVGDVCLREGDDVPGLRRVVRPDTGEAVCLQLGAYRSSLGAGLARALPERP